MNPLFSPVKKNLKMWLMDEYIDRLKAVDENIWAHYAFRFERSIPREKIPSYAARARSDIDKLLATQKAATIDTFIKDLGIKKGMSGQSDLSTIKQKRTTRRAQNHVPDCSLHTIIQSAFTLRSS